MSEDQETKQDAAKSDEIKQNQDADSISTHSSATMKSTSSASRALDHHIGEECEQLLRTTKTQVKRLMEEAVTRKFIPFDSGGLVSLCVAVDDCLTHGLKRRVLGLFKTSSSMALVHKLAKSCKSAQKILESVEKYKLDWLASEQQQQQKNGNNGKIMLQQQTDQHPTTRRYLWIKFALIEKKLVEIVEMLAKSANKYYEPSALMSDHSCAQILCSLLVGPSALEFSRQKTSESISFQEDPTAYELVKRHKLANPIACLCKQHSNNTTLEQDHTNNNENNMDQNDCDKNNNNSEISGMISNKQTNLEASKNLQQNQTTNNNYSSATSSKSSFKSSSKRIQRRRPLSIKTNAKRPILMTECHHYSCQEIAEHQQLRGYSMLATPVQGPLSAPSPGSFVNQAINATRSNCCLVNTTTTTTTTDDNQQPQQVNHSSSLGPSQADQSWSLWSPRMLHEIMHQNSRFRLLYAKNNILLENKTNSFVPGYLSLHDTETDLILKWTPNQMINGCQAYRSSTTITENSGQDAKVTNNNNDNASNDHHQNIYTHSKVKAPDWDSIKDPTPIESSYLAMVVSIPISSIVLLHCRFRSSSIDVAEDLPSPVNKQLDGVNGATVNGDSQETTTDNQQINSDNDSSTLTANESCEETLILVEADGIQRAPFRFPKGGLRLFLSCLDAGLTPTQRYLDPAISLDQSSQWPQHPLANGSFPGSSKHAGQSSGRSTPLGHSNSLGNPSATELVGSMGSRTCDEQEPYLGRLDSILSRFPSLKRRVRTKHSNSNEETTPTTRHDSQSSSSLSPGLATNNNESESGHKLAPTNNYIYRIVSMNQQQSSWQIATPGDGSIVCSSPICVNNMASTDNPQTIAPKPRQSAESVVSGFARWNLRRWTNFAASNNSSSSIVSNTKTTSSTTTSCSNNASGQLTSDLTLDQMTMASSDLDDGSPTSMTPGKMSFNNQDPRDNQRSLTASYSEEQGNDQFGTTTTSDQFASDDNSLKLARIEAKLNDIKKSTSEEVLETFRTQSIETLCKSMRKQIVARAFYGWLVHCRRSKMIRQHLSHLLLAPDCKLHIVASELEQSDKFSCGLTQDIWKSLIGNKQNNDELSIAQRVSSYVYFGGIESNELRRQVWPYLLKYHAYSTGADNRRQKELESRNAYDECATQWNVIEREVLRRDNEILAANIARAKRDITPKNTSQTTIDEVDSEGDKNEDIPGASNGALEPVESGMTTTSREPVISSSDHMGAAGDDDDGVTGLERVLVGPALPINVNNNCESNHTDNELESAGSERALTSLNSSPYTMDSGLALPLGTPVQSSISLEPHERRLNLTSDISTLESSSAPSSLLPQSNEEHDSKEDKHSETTTTTKQPVQPNQSKRWRLESTGSVGSDAPITDQFGNNIHRIDKDVQRCDRNFWFFKDKQNLDKLRNIMCTYVWQNLKVGYVQGMCDLAAPFLVIFNGDEVEAYQCFNQLMKRMVNNFPLGSAMDQHFDALRYLIQVMDPKLFQVLQCNNEDNSCFYFCYRWLLLDFKRELSYGDVYLVWETIWAARDIATDHFVVFMALAMVRYYRDIIIENNMDYTDTLKFFNEMAERHDIRRILRLARESVAELYSMVE